MSAVPERLTRLACDPVYRAIAAYASWRYDGTMRYRNQQLHIYEPGGEDWGDERRGREAGVYSMLPGLLYFGVLAFAAVIFDSPAGMPIVLGLGALAVAAAEDFGELKVTRNTAADAELIGRAREVLS